MTSESVAAVEVAGPTRDEPREPAATQDELRGRSGRQYMLSLKSAFVTALAKAERAAAGDPSSAPRPDPGVVTELRAIFARYEGPKADWGAPDVWDDAFSAERLMVDLYDDDALGVELARRTLDMRTPQHLARGILQRPHPGAGPRQPEPRDRAGSAEPGAAVPPDPRPAVGVQPAGPEAAVFASGAEARRLHLHRRAGRVRGRDVPDLPLRPAEGRRSDRGADARHARGGGGAAMRMESLPYGLITAAVSGLLGAAFFMLVDLQKRVSVGELADIREMWTMPFVIARCIVGVGAASILYFFFKSGLLEGSLWPDLESLGFVAVKRGYELEGVRYELIDTGRKVVPNADFALLVVWSFLAGWSQTLVPNLLLSTEGRQS